MRLKVGPPLAGNMAIPSIGEPRKSFNNTRSLMIQPRRPYRSGKRIFTTLILILGMDENNVADLKRMAPAGTEHKIHLFATESVPDPWYTGDFEETYRRVLAGCEVWLDQLATS